MNPVAKLREHGQAPWLDFIDREILDEGGLERHVREDGLTGVTSNPTIFDEAISGGDDYEEDLRELLTRDRHMGAQRLFERLAIDDIRRAADVLASVYEETDGADGFVSFEVSPYLAHDTEGTCEYARRLFDEIDRPNIMIKVPATEEGIPAIERLIGDGVNVNVTLMFSLDHYEAVSHAYIRGLERLREAGREEELGRVASVASFFVSRVDGKVDPRLESRGGDEALALKGKIGIANSKLAYRRYQEIFEGERFAELREAGARVQRVLWASTSTKDPDYPDVLYVENLIGPETVDTMPPKTLEAFRDHGEVRETVTEDVGEAERQVGSLAGLGIDFDEVTEELQREGVRKFAASYDHLLATLERERRRILAERASGHLDLRPGKTIGEVGKRLQRWQDEGFSRRLWAHDRSLWDGEAGGGLTEGSEGAGEILDRLGWLHLPESMVAEAAGIAGFAREVRDDGIRRVVLLGMGGSSLAPEVFSETFEGHVGDGWPGLSVLDSTHPDAVRRVAEEIDPASTLFVVSSKSGTTIETLSLFRTFWDRLEGVEERGSHFVAVTDPGTPLAELGAERGFRRVFTARSDVGGRYSALTHFGLVPAALLGIDVEELLGRAFDMAAASFERPAMTDEALALGAALGELARAGRDKVTFFATPGLAAFPDWLEQLVAESTGKSGRGIVPVAHEAPGEADEYGDDRFFVAFLLEGDEAAADELHARLDELETEGHATARIELADPYDLGREIFRWEVAVAAAGAVLGIHPFNQPDVQLAKDLAQEALEGDGGDAEDGRIRASDRERLVSALEDWLESGGDDDYVSVHAYVAPGPETTEALERLQEKLRDETGHAATWGYGPRFLHSTGQLHKGGPATGLFLQLVDAPRADLEVPESDYSFGRLIRGQADGDLQALHERDRRVLAVDLGDDPAAGLAALEEALDG